MKVRYSRYVTGMSTAAAPRLNAARVRVSIARCSWDNHPANSNITTSARNFSVEVEVQDQI